MDKQQGPDYFREAFAGDWLKSHGVEGKLVVLTEGPSSRHPYANNRMELIDLSREAGE